jgi:hypothetical protein
MKTLESFGDFLLVSTTIFVAGIIAPVLVSIFLSIFTDTLFSDCLYNPLFLTASCAGWVITGINTASGKI